jgi:asparagine synthase (glutamine-hydrolysing)
VLGVRRMCGIAGLLHLQGPPGPDAKQTCGAMLRRLAHRGPDGEGITAVGGSVLGHKRLSIIDLGGGAQPLCSPSGRVWLVFNGEIYNYQELRRELEPLGHRFRTSSDSEVLAAAIDEWGAAALPKLRGMFAFVAHDQGRRVLLMARDRLGKKPLYYALRGGCLGFSSELPSLLAWGAIDRRPDLGALGEYLRHGYIPAPTTAIEGVLKLPAGALLEVPLGATTLPLPRTYWSLAYTPKVDDRARAVDELAWLVDEAVRDRLIADVPVGAFLSAGLDSSLVVHRASRLVNEPLRTFTVGFDLGDGAEVVDERPEARALAALAGTRHTERTVSIDAAADLPALVRFAGEPFADPSMLPTHAVATAAQGEVKVVLTGDGGDETFAGYHRYARSRISALYGRFPAPLRRGAGAVLGALGVGRARLLEAEERAAHGGAAAHAAAMQTFTAGRAEGLFHPDHRPAVARSLADDPLLRLYDEAPPGEWLDRLLYTDLKSYLADGVLVKADRMTMACSLEARSPLLDHRIVERAARLPAAWKRPPGGEGKALLREVAGRSMPAWVMDRPKRGFNLPVKTWLTAGPFRAAVDDALGGSELVAHGVLDAAAVQRELADPRRGSSSIGNRLFSLYVLELWYRDCVLGARAA